MGDFGQQVKEVMDAYKARLLAVAQSSISDLTDEVLFMARTPVDTGAFLGNMNASIGSPDSSFIQGKTDPDGDRTRSSIQQTIMAVALGDVFYLTNGAPYGPVLEYGLYPNPPKGGTGKTAGGFSTQAPSGVFRVSVAKWDEIVKKNAQGLNASGLTATFTGGKK